MSIISYEAFTAEARALGYDEVLVREWQPDQEVGLHTHPFDVSALVVRGELWLGCGDDRRHLKAGDRFELATDLPHTEKYGSEGATFWVARRHPPAG
jgi:hypothetical protein